MGKLMLFFWNCFLFAQAVSIFIDMDETGGRANEWIYK